ncbi:MULTISPECIES: hypothetical protein [Bacillales]|nr:MULTISPECIES: hypothetical protein [Bacillales]SCB91475.1 hypothetical protein GA0061087_100413 [Priestia flexa]
MLLEKLKGSLQNLSIELIGDALTIAVSLVIGYYVKVFFLM